MYLKKLRPMSGILIAAAMSFGHAANGEPVDINQADAPLLAEHIVGVGPVLAGAIVAYRLEKGLSIDRRVAGGPGDRSQGVGKQRGNAFGGWKSLPELIEFNADVREGCP